MLYLLKRNGPTYGYELGRALNEHALTDAEIDRGALYRTLQRLETMGNVTSAWDATGSGPARHIYKITKSGEQHLEEWAIVLGQLGQSMKNFVDDVRRLKAEPETAGR